MSAGSGVPQAPIGGAADGGVGVEVAASGLPSWRLLLGGALVLAAVTLWVVMGRGEGSLAGSGAGPNVELLSSAELEDQLHI